MLRTLLTFIVAVALGYAPASALPGVQGGAGVEVVLTKLVKRYLAAMDKGDLEEAMSCWSPRSPMYDHFKRFIQADFAASEETQFVNITLTRWKIKAAQASVRLRFDRRWRDISSKEPGQENHDENVELVKEGGEWEFWLQMEATAHLAEKLDAAKTKEERAALLKDGRELVTADLLDRFVAVGIKYMSEGKVDDARRLNDIAAEYTLKDEEGRELTADALGERLAAFRLRYTNESGPYKQLARSLYDILLAPARGDLKGRSHVVVIPDGILYALPYQALIDEQGKHFIESHSVSYAPSRAFRDPWRAERSCADGIGHRVRQGGK